MDCQDRYGHIVTSEAKVVYTVYPGLSWKNPIDVLDTPDERFVLKRGMVVLEDGWEDISDIRMDRDETAEQRLARAGQEWREQQDSEKRTRRRRA